MIHVLTLLNASLSQSYPKFEDLLYALRREEEEEHSHGWLGSFTASAHDSETAPIHSCIVFKQEEWGLIQIRARV
jgi:hypothetical protein